MDWACSCVNAASQWVLCVYLCQQVRPVCQRSVKCASWIDIRMTDTSETHSPFRHMRLFSRSWSYKQKIINGCTHGLPSSVFFSFVLPFLPHPLLFNKTWKKTKMYRREDFLCRFVEKHSLNYKCIERSLFNSLSGTRGRWCVMEIHSFETTCCTFACDAFVWKPVCVCVNSSIPKKTIPCHNPQRCRASEQ